jgi:ADP-heptose:LPS heptosyltransferase
MAGPKILIVQLGRIGDLILMTAMFKALKGANPDNEIHLLAGRNNYHFATEHPYIDKVHVHTKRILSTVALLYRLRKEKYDFWIDPKDHYSRESHWFARWAKARLKIGYNHPDKPPVFDMALPSQEEQYHDHVAIRNMRALRCFHLENADPRPVLFVNPRFERKVENFLAEHEISAYHCVHLSASKDIRYWPQENWIAFLSAIAGKERRIVVISDPKDSDLAAEIAGKVAYAKHYATKSIVEVFSVVKHADLVITPDTSVVHIAAAFDKPLLGLYSNIEWNNKKFHPLGSHYRMVMSPVPGAFVKDIPLRLVFENYHDLLNESSKELN